MNSLSGHLLIAAPELQAPLFARSVILIIDHGEGGAMGVILNRPTDATASDLPAEVVGEGFAWDKPLHLGGPVPGPLMLLHAVPGLGDREVVPGVYLTLDADKARDVLARKARAGAHRRELFGVGCGPTGGRVRPGLLAHAAGRRRARLRGGGHGPLGHGRRAGPGPQAVGVPRRPARPRRPDHELRGRRPPARAGLHGGSRR